MMSVYMYWLGAGIIFLILEAIGASGIGFLFVGLGALTTGTWLYVSPETNAVTQYMIFFLSSTIWAMILWKPLQRFRIKKNGGYSNIIGDTAYIGSKGLKKDEVGEATWSGTIMKAELAKESTVESLDAGASVVITAVSGNKLIVKPKS